MNVWQLNFNWSLLIFKNINLLRFTTKFTKYYTVNTLTEDYEKQQVNFLKSHSHYMHGNIFFHGSRAKEKGAMIIELRTQSIGHEIIQWNMNKNIKGSCSDRKLITVFFPSLRKRITTLRLLRQLTMLKFIRAFEKWTNELKACQVQ